MIVVTGGAGFIGSAFVSLLNSQGVDDILVVDNLGHSDKWKNLVNLQYRDYLHKDDFLPMLLEDQFDDIEAIVHMGACSATTERDADYLAENNYRYTRYLAAWSIEHEARFIYASSGSTYGIGEQGFLDDPERIPTLRPVNMYGYSKQMFDLWALRHGALNFIAGLKFFNVFGPNEFHKGAMRSMVVKSFEQIQSTGKVELFRSDHPDYADGEQKRDFVYVKDAVKVIAWLLEHPDVCGIYNVGTGQSRSWNELAAAVFAAIGKPENIAYIDMPGQYRGRYQYYTEANLDSLRVAGCEVVFTDLVAAVSDYVQNYLQQSSPYLHTGSWV